MRTNQTLKAFGKTGLMAVLFLLAACSDDSNSSGSGGSDSFIKGKVDNVQFNSLEIQGQSLAVATTSGTGASRLIIVTGSDMDQNTMSVIMLGIDEVGEYTIDTNDDGSVLAYIPANSTSHDTSNCDGATGTLNITTINEERVVGTFSFVGKDDENCSASKTVTNGSFRGVFLQTQN